MTAGGPEYTHRMPLHTYPRRFLALSIVFSLLVLAVSGTVAVTLYLDQSRTADLLSEDIGSRGAAINLDVTLDRLITSHTRGASEVAPLHEQADADLAEIERFADKARERELVAGVKASLADYHARRRAGATAAELADFLRAHTQPAVHDLRAYNGRELAASEGSHRQTVRRMAWGLAAVGLLGAVAGLVFGFGLARRLRRTIQQFLVRVEGASELLGRQLPAVEVQGGDGTDDLVRRVELAVQRLNEQEREVRRAERLAAVGQLAAGVAHEVRNPLTSAILLLETGRKDPAAGGLTADDLDLIEQELHRIEYTLQTFLAFARPPKLERSTFDLPPLLREAVALCRGRFEQAGITAEVVVPAGGGRLTADREQVRQVLVNLLLNAADAMPTGGRVTVAVERTAEAVEIVVADTGAGIPADMLPRLFEPFATGKETGTGLGLVVCQRIAEDHGGTIRGENPPGGGARFTLRLPIG